MLLVKLCVKGFHPKQYLPSLGFQLRKLFFFIDVERALVNSYCYCCHITCWLATTVMRAVLAQKNSSEIVMSLATYFLKLQYVNRGLAL